MKITVNKKLKGNIISDGHNIKGNGVLPNPPINIGIIIEGVINIPWKVILGLYWRGGQGINPGKANSNRNIIGNPKPIGPPMTPGIIYINPMTIWFVLIILVNLTISIIGPIAIWSTIIQNYSCINLRFSAIHIIRTDYST